MAFLNTVTKSNPPLTQTFRHIVSCCQMVHHTARRFNG